jgi:hypothetical protein
VVQSPVGQTADAIGHFVSSVVGSDRSLDWETSSRGDVRSAWIFGLQALLAKQGKLLLVNKKVDEAIQQKAGPMPAAAAGKSRRFSESVMQAQTTNQTITEEYDLGDILATSASDLMKDIGKGKIVKPESIQETLRMMENGHPATRYYSENGTIASKEVHLFYIPPPRESLEKGQKANGKLAWCARGERVEDPSGENTLSLKYLKTVLLKKNTPTFQNESLAHINKHRCFSLIAKLPRCWYEPRSVHRVRRAGRRCVARVMRTPCAGPGGWRVGSCERARGGGGRA